VPLIVTGTCQSNITYGLDLDQKRYDSVVNACCLMEDFNTMPLGGLTKVGEMGMSLSGGQKSRLSLARALYREDSQIVLVDSTLSSLDA